jgi:two-component system response regulator (stage 0 sporulation protein F)
LKKSFNGAPLLIVDDERDLVEILAFEFEHRGAHVFQAFNGREAVEILKREPVKLVLSDIRMPGGDGTGLLRAAKQDNPGRPEILFMTGFADIEPADAYELGAAALFLKPYELRAMMDRCLKLLEPLEERWARPAEAPPARVKLAKGFKRFETGPFPAGEGFRLGRGGFFLALPCGALQSGDVYQDDVAEFDLHFESGELGAIKGRGTILWERERDHELASGVGIEFCSLDDECREAVIRLSRQLSTAAYVPKA